MKKIFILTLSIISINLINSQVPFHRGVNLTGWFQTSGARQIQLSKYSKKDFENIKSLGCDVIRLPINLHYMAGAKPNYTIDPLFFDFLDQVVTWAEELNIYLLLDNHSSDDIASKNPDLEAILIKVWEQMAEHYKDRSKYILFEIMNEPNGTITTAKWSKIQQSAIDAIRKIDTKHTLVVGPASYNSYNDLKLLTVYADTNLIYTFHFYDPFLFTHQGADWPTPSLGPLKGVPYPYNADSMPTLPSALSGTWVKSSFDNYKNDGTLAKIKQLIDVAIAFKTGKNVNIYCGEFGVYNLNSKDSDRVHWYHDVRMYLEENNIPWTIWDYQGGFGMFKKGSNEMFDYDVNIPMVEALGLNPPAQKVYEMKPDSLGFDIYSDNIAGKIIESSNASGGKIDFYSTDKPNNGKYCIFWTGSAQYGAIGFNFAPDKDLSQLASGGYALSFLIRGNTPGTKLDVRFVDSKTSDPTDHPWRNTFTVDEKSSKWDGKWHPVRIPLNKFVETGSWDATWFTPVGKYDWKAVDKLEIVTEYSSLTNKAFWIDNIVVTNMDTVSVNDTSVFTLPDVPTIVKNRNTISSSIFPNPVYNETNILYTLTSNGTVDISIFDMNGKNVKTLVKSVQQMGMHSVNWNVNDNSGNRLSKGIYFCRIAMQDNVFVSKIVVLK